MPRILGGTKTLVIQDNLSDCEIHLHYRMPTPKEIISFRNGGTRNIRNKLVDRTGENRLEHGLKILTGFRDGDFVKFVDGKKVAISSEPKSKDYDPNWKDLVKEQASDLVETLAVQVFNGSSQVLRHAEDSDQEDEDTESN